MSLWNEGLSEVFASRGLTVEARVRGEGWQGVFVGAREIGDFGPRWLQTSDLSDPLLLQGDWFSELEGED